MATRNAADFSAETHDVFARVAERQDRLCDIFSFFIHRPRKSRMAARTADQQAGLILDVATGTGDIPQRLQRILRGRPDRTRPSRFLMTDRCPEMLAIAREKLGTGDSYLGS